MNVPADYLTINKNAWNRKVESHFNSDFYDVSSFKDGKSSLNEIELGLLGEINGKEILHLQCHFGMDSISLAKLGAKVTAVDFSEDAIDKAKELAKELGIQVNFICADVLELDQFLDQKFDLVYTSYGTIGWLEDIEKWAGIVSNFMKPDGKFVFVEFHPVVWMFSDEFNSINFSYFKGDPIIETENGTYAERDSDLQFESVCWNHGLAEVFQSLKNHDLKIDDLQEYNYSPYNCFLGTEEFEPGKFRIVHFENKIPMVYSLVASKK
ncbi:MAG: class I SAM-dependent methyltransferase [Saprospiraceae bacterium]